MGAPFTDKEYSEKCHNGNYMKRVLSAQVPGADSFPRPSDTGHGGRLMFACSPAQHAVSARILSPTIKRPAQCWPLHAYFTVSGVP